MTKDELIQKITFLRDESIKYADLHVGDSLAEISCISQTITYNTVLDFLEELEDCNNVTK